MKLVKYVSWALGALAVLALIVVAAFALLFDPNALRDDITRLVEKQTGRELVIEGDLSLSFYPWLGFAAGRTTLSNPDGFDEPIMARFERASASVKLLPLLRRRVELSRVTLEGLDLTMHVQPDGTSNWDDLAALGDEPDGEDKASGSGFATEGIGGIELEDARVVYLDEQGGQRYELSDLQLESGALRPGSAFPVEATADLVSADPALSGPGSFEGEVEIDNGVVRVTQPRLEINATGESVPGERMFLGLSGEVLTLDGEVLTLEQPELELDGDGAGDPWNELEAMITGTTLVWTGFDALDVAAPRVAGRIVSSAVPDGLGATMSATRLTASVDKQTAKIETVTANALGVDVKSSLLDATQIFDALALSGRIQTERFAPRELLAQLGADDVATADADALQSMTVSGAVNYGPAGLALRDMTAKLDDSSITGSLSYAESGQVKFDLSVDTVNVDRYRSPSQTDGEQDAAAGLEEIEIPVEELRELNLDGKLRIGTMQLVGLKTSNVVITLKAADGNLRVNPAAAELYGGRYDGDITLDVRGELPRLSLNERLQNVDFGPFSSDLMDAERLSGKLDGRITVSGSGQTAAAITQSANGDAQFSFTDGAYEGTDIWYRVRKARAVIEREKPPAEPAEKRTRFADLSGTAKIVDGVMTSDDISMVLPFMKVSGSGSLALLPQTLDFRFRGDLVDRPDLDADVNDLVGITVPLRLTGTVSEPDISVDMGAVLAEVAKRKIGEKLGLNDESGATAEEAVEQKKEELKDKVEDKAKDLLKGLLGGGG